MRIARILAVLVPVLAFASAAPVGRSAAGESTEAQGGGLSANADSTEAKSGWLGVYTDDLTKPMLAALDIGYGVLVTDVAEESPAAKAGIEVGDVITSLDGQAVTDGPALRWAVRGRPGQNVVVEIRRRGKQKKLDVELGTRDEIEQTFNFEWPAIPREALREAERALREAGPALKREIERPDLTAESLREDGEALREAEQALREAGPGLRRELERSCLTLDSLRGQIEELKKELSEFRQKQPARSHGGGATQPKGE